MRGLKCIGRGVVIVAAGVAPFTGAWIEIAIALSRLTGVMVAPFTGAWIEIASRCWLASMSRWVAPFTGAWIEMAYISSWLSSLPGVAPFTGAWIEIDLGGKYGNYLKYKSHPSRVRGLKSTAIRAPVILPTSRTLHGCVD